MRNDRLSDSDIPSAELMTKRIGIQLNADPGQRHENQQHHCQLVTHQ